VIDFPLWLGSPWVYAAACLAVPALWGFAMVRAFGAWERRRRADAKRELPRVDYSI
jgi:hypothetical protein